jgi:hypothetical protein
MLYEALEEKTAAAAPPVSGRIKTLPPSQLIITSVARFGAARPREIGFAMDSPLEEAVSSEPVSGNPKFPASWENTGKFIDFGL